MNAPVLLYGNRAADSVPLAAMALDVSPQETLVLPDVQILYVLHEMPMQAALARLPVALHPSIPAVLGITFMHAKDSPFGEFTLAYVGIACRTGIKPRHFITGAFCANADAARYFGGRYGFDCRHAVVSYHETYDRIRGEVQVDGRSILDVAIAECIPLVGAGGMIKYSPPLTATRVGGEPALVQFEAGYDFKRSIRGSLAARDLRRRRARRRRADAHHGHRRIPCGGRSAPHAGTLPGLARHPRGSGRREEDCALRFRRSFTLVGANSFARALAMWGASARL
jgi:hypothetical protein